MISRCAFVHCWLMPGGARQVLLDLIQAHSFATARIFTLISREYSVSVGTHTIPVVSALPWWLCQIFFFFQDHRVPFFSRLFDYRNLIVFAPFFMYILSQALKRYQPDYTVISSFAIAKNIELPTCSASLLYLHSPNQYVHTHYDEYLSKLHGIKKLLFRVVARPLLQWDTQSRSYDRVLANSHYTADCAYKLYGLTAEVLYPRLSEVFFSSTIVTQPDNYFVYMGRLVRLVKEVDRILRLFARNGHRLVVIWWWPDQEYLKKIASDTILFVGRVEDKHEQCRIIGRSRGLINITKESFGLVTAESLVLWVPVLAYTQWASAELINPRNGVLLADKSDAVLDEAFNRFTHTDFDRKAIAQTARTLFSSQWPPLNPF